MLISTPRDFDALSLEALTALRHRVGGLTLSQVEAAIARKVEPQRTAVATREPPAAGKPHRGNRAASLEAEHHEQVALINKVRELEPAYPELELLFAVPNGGHRNISVAKKMKAEGVRAGVLDLFLPVARWPHPGCAIEMKAEYRYVDPDGQARTRRGSTSDAQDWWIEKLRAQGWRVEVCYSAGAAMEVLLGYLRMPNNREETR